jgi:hypothetical protein
VALLFIIFAVFLDIIKFVTMKRILLIALISITVCRNGSAQSYQSVFGANSTYWIIQWDNLDFSSYSNFFVQYDTLLFNTYPYKKVVADDNGMTRLLLREDTSTGRVWCRSLNPYCGYSPRDTDERLVLDMSLRLGDTFNVKHWVYDGSADTLIIVDSLYYMQGQKYLRFKSPIDSGIIQTFTSSEPITFIEGIGPNYSLLWMRDDCSAYGAPYLLCAYKDSIKANYTNLRFNGDCTPILGGITDINVSQINIFPNPTSGLCTISLNDPISIYTAKLLDISGRVVSDLGEIKNGSLNFSMSEYAKGVYLLSMTDSNGQATIRKLVTD